MKRTFKKVVIEGETYLYPVPVIKEQKYLISCGSASAADELIASLGENKITHPDESSNEFVQVKYHSDGKTPILKIKSN